MVQELHELTNEELLNKLESAEMFATVLESPEWAWFQLAWKRIHDEADRRLSVIDPTDAKAIMQAQYAKRFYANIMETTIRQMHNMSDIAYAEAKERGLLNHFVEKVRAKISAFARR
jgi:hypothetical protein